jgi:predicted Zn-dependent protease
MYIIKRIVLFLSVGLFATPVFAIDLLRDADIEHAFAELSRPVLQAAGLSPMGIKILLLNDKKSNAFIMDNKHIFISSGLVLSTNNAEMFQSIIAHEAAHIAHGHVTRRMQNMSVSRTASAFGLALALMTGAVSGNHELSLPMAIGASSSALGVLLFHSRAEESAADHAAMRYLAQSNIDGKGMIEVLDIFIGQDNLSPSRQDPYLRTHPSSRDRKQAIKALVKTNATIPTNHKDAYWHERAVGKISAFIRGPEWTLKSADNAKSTDVRHLRRAVALSRQGKVSSALEEMEKAQELRPNDPYLQELKAELLMRNKRFAQSVKEYSKAVSMDPNNALALSGYGRALLANKQTNKALSVLKKAREADFRNTRLLRDLAITYSKLGKNNMAALVTAERYALSGNIKDAIIHARRASKRLPIGSTAWQRAQDVLNVKIPE